jgi:hypothetical protein
MATLKSFFPVFALMLFLTGCVFYQRYPLAKSRLDKINKEQLTFYLLDAAHVRSRVWYISEAQFEGDKITGFLVRLTEMEATEVATISNNRDAKMSREEVLLYAKPKFAMTLTDTMTATIPHDQLEKIEVYEVNHGKSVIVSMFSILLPLVFLAALSGN